MYKNNRNLLVISGIAIVNALGYGIIIPIMYTYSQKYGLTDFQNGLLFSLFSICQFLSTPVIGRLSDKYGRKPLLLISLMGTVISFVMMAFAPNALFLFIARALDGITAGNIPVASAVISDTTHPKDRAKGFGIIGASFGFGFIFGPLISTLTVGFDPAIPFLIAAIVSLVSFVMTFVLLTETNKQKKEITNEPLINFNALFLALKEKTIGVTLIISLLYSLAFALFIFAYQPFAVKVLHASAQLISLNFTLIGVIGLVSQLLFIPIIMKKVSDRRALFLSLTWVAGTLIALTLSQDMYIFIFITLLQAIGNSFINPLIQTLLSKEVDMHSQGSILGVNSSYVSIGMIFGPIVGGILATLSLSFPFIIGGFVVLICSFLLFTYVRRPFHRLKLF